MAESFQVNPYRTTKCICGCLFLSGIRIKSNLRFLLSSCECCHCFISLGVDSKSARLPTCILCSAAQMVISKALGALCWLVIVQKSTHNATNTCAVLHLNIKGMCTSHFSTITLRCEVRLTPFRTHPVVIFCTTPHHR